LRSAATEGGSPPFLQFDRQNNPPQHPYPSGLSAFGSASHKCPLVSTGVMRSSFPYYLALLEDGTSVPPDQPFRCEGIVAPPKTLSIPLWTLLLPPPLFAWLFIRAKSWLVSSHPAFTLPYFLSFPFPSPTNPYGG